MSKFSFPQGQDRLTVSIVELLPNTGAPALQVITELGAYDELVDEPELIVQCMPLDEAGEYVRGGCYNKLKNLVVEAFTIASERGIRCRLEGNTKGANICANQKTTLVKVVDYLASAPEFKNVLLGYN